MFRFVNLFKVVSLVVTVLLSLQNEIHRVEASSTESDLSWLTNNVILLNSTTIETLVFRSRRPWLVYFFSSIEGKCPGCSQIGAQLVEAADQSKDYFNTGAFDLGKEDGSKILKRLNIQGYPTIVGFSEPGRKNAYSTTNEYYRPNLVLNLHSIQQVTARKIKKFALELLPTDQVTFVDNSNFTERFGSFEEKIHKNRFLILFTDKQEVSNQLKSLSTFEEVNERSLEIYHVYVNKQKLKSTEDSLFYKLLKVLDIVADDTSKINKRSVELNLPQLVLVKESSRFMNVEKFVEEYSANKEDFSDSIVIFKRNKLEEPLSKSTLPDLVDFVTFNIEGTVSKDSNSIEGETEFVKMEDSPNDQEVNVDIDEVNTPEKLISFLQKNVPSIIAVIPQGKHNSLPASWSEKKQGLTMKGFKTGVLKCDSSPLKEFEVSDNGKQLSSLYAKVVETLCSSKLTGIQAVDTENSEPAYAAIVYTDSFEAEIPPSVTSLTMGQILALEQDVSEIFFDKLKEKVDSMELFSDIDLAAKKSIKSFPSYITVFDAAKSKTPINNQLRAFLESSFSLSNNRQNSGANLIFPCLFFASEKVDSPPIMLSTFSYMFRDLFSVGFITNMDKRSLIEFGLPVELHNQNTFILFSKSNTTYLNSLVYDARVFGKYTTMSIISFCVNALHQIHAASVESTHKNELDLWLLTNNNHLRLPFDISASNSSSVEQSSEQSDESALENNSSESYDVDYPADDNIFKQRCLYSQKGFKVPHNLVCVIGFFDADQKNKYLTSQKQTLVDLAANFTAGKAGSSTTALSSFSYTFLWVPIYDACSLNKEFASRFGISPDLTPGLAVYHPYKKYGAKMLFSFTYANSASYLKKLSFNKGKDLKPMELIDASSSKEVKKEDLNQILLLDDLSCLIDRVKSPMQSSDVILGVEEDEANGVEDILKEIQEEERRAKEDRKKELKEAEKANLKKKQEEAEQKEKKKKKTKKKSTKSKASQKEEL